MMGGMTRTRLAAVAAALTVTGGGATMLVALVATPGPWWQGYVSEAGTDGRPHAVAYRWGLMLLALGVALLGLALHPGRRGSRVRLGRLRDGTVAAVCLAVAAALAGTSGAVSCSHRCPLPPYEQTTLADIVHATASILGVGAMAAVWLADPRAPTRRLAVGAAALTVPLGGVLGLTMLLAGRGTLGGVLERLLLLVEVVWVVGTALLTAADPVGVRETILVSSGDERVPPA